MKSSIVEVELFRHILSSIAEEMGIVLRKTAYSANIKERRDFSCAVYDAQGDTVAMGDRAFLLHYRTDGAGQLLVGLGVARMPLCRRVPGED